MVQGSQAGRAGLDEAFRQLFDRHGEEIFRFFLRQGLPTEDARELTQETFVRVYQGMDGFRGEATARTWVFTIARNAFRNALRHEGAAKRQGGEVPLDPAPSPGEADLPEREPPDPEATDPLESVLSRERRERLRRAVEELPDRMRHCVLLRVYQDRKYREIATVLQVSIETVKSQLHQAKGRLRRRLGEEFQGWDDLGGPS